MKSGLAIDELRKDIIMENNSDRNGGGWSDFIVESLRPGHRNLRDSLQHIVSAGDVFATPRQRSLARQALGRGSGVLPSAEADIGEAELLEEMARAL